MRFGGERRVVNTSHIFSVVIYIIYPSDVGQDTLSNIRPPEVKRSIPKRLSDTSVCCPAGDTRGHVMHWPPVHQQARWSAAHSAAQGKRGQR